MLEENNEKKKEWFFKGFLELERNKIRNDCYKFMNEIKINVKFFAWLENFKFDNKLNMVNRTTKTWLKQDDNKVVHL